jgi:hypothetical protein
MAKGEFIMIEYITWPLIYIILFIVFMLVHELMHIKGWGIKSTGKIYVDETTFTASCDNSIEKYYGWGYLNGGLLTSILCYLLAIMIPDFFMRGAFLTIGTVQLVYGIYEWLTPKNKVWQRYLIYIGVSLITFLIYWILA